jgi:predicted O-methyltransferase YrrM
MINRIKKIINNPSLTVRTLFKKFIRLIPFNQEYSRLIYATLSHRLLRDNRIRDIRPSIIYSLEKSKTSDYLIETSVEAIKRASSTKLRCGKKNLSDSKFLNEFPGEHYRVISSIVNVTNANKVVEIGTYTGLGTLSIKEGFKKTGNIKTFDIIEWDKLNIASHLDKSDFNDSSIKQLIGDLSDNNFFNKNIDVLNEAEIIFMDAPKDDKFEYKMINQFLKLEKKKK